MPAVEPVTAPERQASRAARPSAIGMGAGEDWRGAVGTIDLLSQCGGGIFTHIPQIAAGPVPNLLPDRAFLTSPKRRPVGAKSNLRWSILCIMVRRVRPCERTNNNQKKGVQ